MNKKLFILFFFLAMPRSYCQTYVTSETATGLSETEFGKLKIEYGKMTVSESYKLMRKDTMDFAIKLKDAKNPVLNPQDAWIAWITENLSQTSFTSVKEADDLKQQGVALSVKVHDEFGNVYAMLEKASKKQRLDLLRAERSGEFNK